MSSRVVLTAKKAALEKAAAEAALEKAAAEAKLAEELSGILRQFVLLLHEAIVECALISLCCNSFYPYLVSCGFNSQKGRVGEGSR